MENKENKYLVTLKKPYSFEGTEYKEVDLSGITELKAMDFIKAESYSGAVSRQEFTMGYALYVASCASGLPIEFFERLDGLNAVEIKYTIQRFFMQ